MAHADGELALVLHTHMPYVEGFGTWPFGEEWLWEALATCWLPLADLLDAVAPAPLTLSLTPVLADQLEADGTAARFRAFLTDVRRATHALDAEGCRAGGEPGLAAEVQRAAGDYEHALQRFDAREGDALAALAPHVAWGSAATHAVLPLLATHAGVRLQLDAGRRSHERRFGAGAGGLWLPECAHAPWLDPLLGEAGVRATCLDLTDVLGRGSPEHLRPRRSAAGVTLVPVDRAILELVWSPGGYPAHGAYRDYHHRTVHDHRPWANDGSVYDPVRARAQARADAADFVARARERVAGGGLCVCALDTELLGHWWYEGLHWLAAVLEEAERQGLRLAALDDALARHAAIALEAELPTTTWGTPRDLSTWDRPEVAALAWGARRAELEVVARGGAVDARAARELLALQSSDWAFVVTQGLAAPYGRERADGHRRALARALAGLDSGAPEPARLRSLAPDLSLAPLLAPL